MQHTSVRRTWPVFSYPRSAPAPTNKYPYILIVEFFQISCFTDDDEKIKKSTVTAFTASALRWYRALRSAARSSLAKPIN